MHALDSDGACVLARAEGPGRVSGEIHASTQTGEPELLSAVRSPEIFNDHCAAR